MTQEDLEKIYDLLAASINAVGQQNSEVYLAKVVLALADTLGSADRASAIFKECQSGLDKTWPPADLTRSRE